MSIHNYFTKNQKKQLWHWIASCAPDRLHEDQYWQLAVIDEENYDVHILCHPLKVPKIYSIQVYKELEYLCIYRVDMKIKDFKRKLRRSTYVKDKVI